MFATFDIVDVQPRQRRKGERASFGRRREAPYETRLHRSDADAIGRAQVRAQGLDDLEFKGNLGDLAGSDIHPSNTPVLRVHDGRAVRHECIAGEQIARETGLLLVTLRRPGEPPVLAGLQVADTQSAGTFVPCHIDEALAVR